MKLVKELKKKNKYKNLDPLVLEDMLTYLSNKSYTDYTIGETIEFAFEKHKARLEEKYNRVVRKVLQRNEPVIREFDFLDDIEKNKLNYEILRNHFDYLFYETGQIKISRKIDHSGNTMNMYCLIRDNRND